MRLQKVVLWGWVVLAITVKAQTVFNFENTLNSGALTFAGTPVQFVGGLDGQALRLSREAGQAHLALSGLELDGGRDFTVQFWVKTASDQPTVLLSQKAFKSKGIAAQKHPGWALYTSHGALGWCVGSGRRRLNYERDNGEKMPLTDGRWHHVTLTFSKALTEMRLYYDGRPVAVYKVGFNFSNDEPLRMGVPNEGIDHENVMLTEIEDGAKALQAFVDVFQALGAGQVEDDAWLDLIVDPEALYEKKRLAQGLVGVQADTVKLKRMRQVHRALRTSPYTVYQNRKLTALKPVSRLYGLEKGRVVMDKRLAMAYTTEEQLHPADFDMDELSIHETVLSADEVLAQYRRYRTVKAEPAVKTLQSLTVGVWNIWHGGIHWNEKEHGWDSRRRIVEMLKANEVDVLLMQESYSNGDFIAAELGWVLATTSDWDYCFQGSNISVLSRFPITELHVLPAAEFNNVAVKLQISETQSIHAMSNWYGMRIFPDVYTFHEARFAQSETTPVFFGGDFNAVPHTDGGESPASLKMLENGFTDAYRSLFPDVEQYPGFSHQEGVRIDQLYYKGRGVRHQSTEVISTWPGGFPSDHFLIVSRFQLLE